MVFTTLTRLVSAVTNNAINTASAVLWDVAGTNLALAGGVYLVGEAIYQKLCNNQNKPGQVRG